MEHEHHKITFSVKNMWIGMLAYLLLILLIVTIFIVG